MIIYRAIRESNYEFVYGFVLRPARVENGRAVSYYFNAIDRFPHIEDSHFRVSEVVVLADSIELCTGEVDSTGSHLVFEGDILQAEDCYGSVMVVKFGRFVPPTCDTRRFQAGNVGFYVEPKEKTDYTSDLLRKDILFWLPISKVVGNIHDLRAYDTCQYCEWFDFDHFSCEHKRDCAPCGEICDEFTICECQLGALI